MPYQRHKVFTHQRLLTKECEHTYPHLCLSKQKAKDQRLEAVENLKYLELVISKKGFKPESNSRIAQTTATLYKVIRGSCKTFCHWDRITSGLRFIKPIFITNLQNSPLLLKHIFVTFLPSREKQINSLLLVSVGDIDK